MRTPLWLQGFRALVMTILGAGDLIWEFGVDRLHHWAPSFILALWLLGGPIDQLVTLLTSGRIQINVRPKPPDESESEQPTKPDDA